MTITTLLMLLLPGIYIGWTLFKPMSSKKLKKAKRKLQPGDRLRNKRGVHYTVDSRGALRNTETIGEFVNHPKVKRQIDAFHRMYMQQTLMALHEGNEPPNSVGGYGILTKKKLMSVWDDEWQAELDKMNEYYDVTYDSFFNIQEEHPPAGIILTAEEILAEYGSEKES